MIRCAAPRLTNPGAENYGSCNRDCAAALRLNPKNVKAWYRAASACLALDKIPEAMDACQSGLQYDAGNKTLEAIRTTIEKRCEHLAGIDNARDAREQKAAEEQKTLQLALRTRNIRTRSTDSPPDMEDAAISLANSTDPSSTLSLPVIFLYPLHGQTDFIKSVAEDESLGQHLDYILPTPWDEASEYQLESVECYVEIVQGGLIKAGKKLPLLKILGGGKVEIVDGLVRVYVVPKAKSSRWIEDFKTRRGRG